LEVARKHASRPGGDDHPAHISKTGKERSPRKESQVSGSIQRKKKNVKETHGEKGLVG